MTDWQQQAHIRISCRDLAAETAFLHDLGFRTEQVFPADNPRWMLLTGWGLVLRLERGLPVNDLTLLLPAQAPPTDEFCVSPSGVTVTRISQPESTHSPLPELNFSLNSLDPEADWVTGRAGMRYRDLLPDRLDGLMIASNICIPEGGPVPDQVHHHAVDFQLIVCVKGWVEVVYEHQGPPFRLTAGDCVTQPPGIRHRVLAASDGLEVVEIGLPAEHLTLMDHQLNLPNDEVDPGHLFHGQRFSHHRQEQASWEAWQGAEWQRAATQVAADSGGLFAVHFLQGRSADAAPLSWSHQNPLRWYYVLKGGARLVQHDGTVSEINAGDSFLLPANQSISLQQPTDSFQCLELVMLRSPDEFL